MTRGVGIGREDGQLLPGLVMLLLAILALGIIGFQIGKAAIQRSQAQTAADAAALAGAREIKRQLEQQWATFGTTDISAIDENLVVARMREYADRNGGRLDPKRPPQIDGVDVRVWVETYAKLGKDAEDVGQEDWRGSARARAALSLGTAVGGVGPVGGTNAAGNPMPSAGGTPKVTEDEWEEIREQIGKPPLSCPEDVITLGLFLKAQGFQVWQNAHPQLGGDAGHEDKPQSWHRQCGDMGALDVNFGACGNYCPSEMAALNPIMKPIQEMGFYVLWLNYEGHYDHMHIDPSTSASPTGGGFAGPMEDVGLDVKLVDWDKELEDISLLGTYPTVNSLGEPDLKIVKLICQMSEPYGPKIRLAAFEAAIVESGIRNLNYGHAESHGVFQQQWSVGEWGTKEQTMDPVHATRMFLQTARRMDEGQSAGELAADVQRPREDLRYKYGAVEGQARSLIGAHC